ncbi:MAG: hypothetical protein ACP5UH_01085 [Candidatus Micrarchaeia archaeon]
MNSIIVDTSSILFGFENRKNVFDIVLREWHGCRLLMPSSIMGELRKKAQNSGKSGAYAKAALALLHNVPAIKIRGGSNADSWIVGNALPRKALVVTNDTLLGRRLAEMGVKVFRLSRNGMLRAYKV